VKECIRVLQEAMITVFSGGLCAREDNAIVMSHLPYSRMQDAMITAFSGGLCACEDSKNAVLMRRLPYSRIAGDRGRCFQWRLVHL
jgi:hypothetical protein